MVRRIQNRLPAPPDVGHWDYCDDPFTTENVAGIGCQYARQWKLHLVPGSTIADSFDEAKRGPVLFTTGGQVFRVGIDPDVLWGPNVPGLVLRSDPQFRYCEPPHLAKQDRFISIDLTAEGGRNDRQRPTPKYVPISAGSHSGPDIGPTFDELVTSWRKSTELFSSASKIVMDKSYQRIIGLGPAVLPYIFRELAKAPEAWGWALQAITGADPASGAVTLRGAAEIWLDWAKNHGHLAA